MECELCDFRTATLMVSDGWYSFTVCPPCADKLGWSVIAEADRRG